MSSRDDRAGTVRKSPGGTVVIRNTDTIAGWETFNFGTNDPEILFYSDDEVADWQILGAAPGTPADTRGI